MSEKVNRKKSKNKPEVERDESDTQLEYYLDNLTRIDSTDWQEKDVKILFALCLNIIVKVDKNEDEEFIKLRGILNIFNYLYNNPDRLDLVNITLNILNHTNKLDKSTFHQFISCLSSLYDQSDDEYRDLIVDILIDNHESIISSTNLDLTGSDLYNEIINRREQIFNITTSLAFLVSFFNDQKLAKIAAEFLYFESQIREVGFVDKSLDCSVTNIEADTFLVSAKLLPFYPKESSANSFRNILNVLFTILEEFGYDAERDLKKFLTMGGKDVLAAVYTEIYVVSKLEALRPGSVVQLRRRFGFQFLSRYIRPESVKRDDFLSEVVNGDSDVKMLLDLLDNGNLYQKYICVYTPAYDHSMGFMADFERELFYDSYFKLKSKGIKVIFVESENQYDCVEKIKYARFSTGLFKFDAIMLRFHGHKYNINFGPKQEDMIGLKEIDPLLSGIKAECSSDAQLIYNSCGVGQDGGIAYSSTGQFDTVISGKGNFGTITSFDADISGTDLKFKILYLVGNKQDEPPRIRTKKSKK